MLKDVIWWMNKTVKDIILKSSYHWKIGKNVLRKGGRKWK